MKIVIENADENDFNELTQLARIGRIHTFYLTDEDEGSQVEIKKYKPLEPDYNVQCAVENLKTAYWSNDSRKMATAFVEAEEIIMSAICHHGYVLCKQTQGEWIEHNRNYDAHSMRMFISCECSACHMYEDFPQDNETGNVLTSHYCKWCGSNMWKEEQE